MSFRKVATMTRPIENVLDDIRYCADRLSACPRMVEKHRPQLVAMHDLLYRYLFEYPIAENQQGVEFTELSEMQQDEMARDNI